MTAPSIRSIINSSILVHGIVADLASFFQAMRKRVSGWRCAAKARLEKNPARCLAELFSRASIGILLERLRGNQENGDGNPDRDESQRRYPIHLRSEPSQSGGKSREALQGIDGPGFYRRDPHRFRRSGSDAFV